LHDSIIVSATIDVDRLDPGELTRQLRARLGPFVEGAVVGRTDMRDELVRQLDCSQLMAEQLVDTIILRGFVVQERTSDGRIGWFLRE
jgi:hypothetical protein